MTGFVAYWVYQEPVFFLHPTTGKVTSGIIEEWREAKPGRGQESQLEGGISRQVLKRYGSEFQVLIRETGTKEEPVLLFANELYEFREDAEHAAVCAYVRKHRKRVVRKQMAEELGIPYSRALRIYRTVIQPLLLMREGNGLTTERRNESTAPT